MATQATISFDLDGVLIQNPFAKGVGPRVRAHIRQAQALAGLETCEADRRINDAVRSAWGARMAAGDFVRAYDWDDIYSHVSHDFGGTDVPDIAGIVEACCREEGMIALLPGAKECLTELQQAGFRLVAATNGYHAYQWPVLAALGIADFFDELLSPDRVGHAKPDPRFFAGIPGLRTHVGDTLVHDVLGANMAGVQAIWLSSELPDELDDLSPRARVANDGFERYLEQALERTPYREYHPEATVVTCRPSAVVKDAREVPRAVLQLAGMPAGA
ncbi:MAG TPA: HAD family hydrolase [Trueperaceae bacterium]